MGQFNIILGSTRVIDRHLCRSELLTIHFKSVHSDHGIVIVYLQFSMLGLIQTSGDSVFAQPPLVDQLLSLTLRCMTFRRRDKLYVLGLLNSVEQHNTELHP